MKLSDIMIKVEPILLSDSIEKAISIMAARDIDILPVLDTQNKMIGALKPLNILSALKEGAQLFQEIGPYVDRCGTHLSINEKLDGIPAKAVPAVVVDDEGTPAGVVTTSRFSSALQTYLMESKEKLSAVIESTQNGFLAIDEKGIIILANRLVREMIGRDNNDLVGSYIKDIIPNTLMLKIVETGKPLMGQKFVLGNTSIMANYSPIFSNGIIAGAVSVFQNLSEIEKISEKLGTVKALNMELEAIINSSYDGIWITDGRGVVLNINKASEQFSERKASDIVGKTMNELVNEGFVDRSVTLLVMKKRERITINQTVEGKRKLLVTGNPIFDDQGNLFRIVTNVRDITELTKLQDQLSIEKKKSQRYKTELTHLRSMHITGSDLIFRSTSMRKIVDMAARIADVDSTVLITGETGTGKELVAKLIHRLGKGYRRPCITINCAAIPEQLLESELFGYEGGAFTGAKKEGKLGMFELAHTGTLFLDEIGELPLALQVKLLRSIQEKEVFRIGGTKPIPVDVRIIAATNKDPKIMLKEKTFREDLYYRLMVVPIHVPPLRDRREDIPLLVHHFIDEFNQHFGYQKTISPQVLDRLLGYNWPGNVRELRNVIERIIVISQGDEIVVNDLPSFMNLKKFVPKVGVRLKDAIIEMETFLLYETYKSCGSWLTVAKVLGVNYTTVYRKVARYQLMNRD